jgi:hypothetical protein
MNLSKSINQGDIRATSKHLGTKRLKLITKSCQEVIGLTKLKCDCLISAGLTSGRRQLRAKSVKLTSNNRKLIKKDLNCSEWVLLVVGTRSRQSKEAASGPIEEVTRQKWQTQRHTVDNRGDGPIKDWSSRPIG